jgi:hypothetical protein
VSEKSVGKNRYFHLPTSSYLLACNFVMEQLAQINMLRFHLQCCEYDQGKFNNNQLIGDGDCFAYILICNKFFRNFPIFFCKLFLQKLPNFSCDLIL